MASWEIQDGVQDGRQKENFIFFPNIRVLLNTSYDIIKFLQVF